MLSLGSESIISSKFGIKLPYEKISKIQIFELLKNKYSPTYHKLTLSDPNHIIDQLLFSHNNPTHLSCTTLNLKNGIQVKNLRFRIGSYIIYLQGNLNNFKAINLQTKKKTRKILLISPVKNIFNPPLDE